MIKNASLLCFMFSMLLCIPINAQTKFEISAPDSIPLNQEFELDIIIENSTDSGFKAPSLRDFELSGGPKIARSRTAQTWVNDKSSTSITYCYYLKPRKQGTFKTGRATISENGEHIESNDLSITIIEPEMPKPLSVLRTISSRYPFYHASNDKVYVIDTNSTPAELTEKIRNDVFVKLVVSKDTVHLGELLTATYTLYYYPDIESVNTKKMPVMDGFQVQEEQLDIKRNPSSVSIRGKQGAMVDLLKYNLYPKRIGTLHIGSLEVAVIVEILVRSNRQYDSVKLRRIPLTLKTVPVNITVLNGPQKK